MNNSTNKSMIRKRQRNEMNSDSSSINLSSKGQSTYIKGSRKDKASFLNKAPFYSQTTNEKFISLISDQKCICKKEIGNSAPFEFCNNCFRFFHSMCLKEHVNLRESEESSNDSGVDSGMNGANENNCFSSSCGLNFICPFCDHKLKGKCINCSKTVKEQQIRVDCELCGSLMHLNCLNVPLFIIYNRSIYQNYFISDEKFKQFLDDLKIICSQLYIVENQTELLKDFLLKVLPEQSCQIFINPFHICKHCLFFNAENLNFISRFLSKEGPVYEEIYCSNLSYIHNLHINSTAIPTGAPKNHGTEIICFDYKLSKLIDYFSLYDNASKEGKYLIKWQKSPVIYSFENSKFIERLFTNDQALEDFNKRKMRQNEFYSEFYTKEIRPPIRYEFPKLIKEIEGLFFSHQNKSNQILKEFGEDDSNFYIINDTNSLDEMRVTVLAPLVNSIIQLLKTKVSSKVNNPKILICCDEISTVKKWKKLFIFFGDELSVVNLKYKRRFQTLLYEMFYMDLKKLNKNLRSFDENLFLQDNAKEKVDKFFRLMETIMIDYNNTKFDVMLIDKKAYWFSYANVLSKMNFDLTIMDFSDKDSVSSIKDLIKNETNKANPGKMLIMNSITKSEEQEFSNYFSNFLYLFYDSDDWLIDVINTWNQKIKLLSNKIKYFPKAYEDLVTFLRWEFNWKVMNLAIKSNPYMMSSESSYVDVRKDNFMECELNNVKVILNFVPVNLSKLDFLQYISILKERKIAVLDKKTENKNDIIKSLVTFCSFPSLMGLYYRNKLQDINLKVAEDSFNTNKLRCMVSLINHIFSTLRENKSPENFSFYKKEEICINIIYSLFNNNDEISKSDRILRSLKENLYKEFNRERSLINFYSTTDDIKNILLNGEKQNVFIFFNIPIYEKSIGKLFRGLLNYFKNRNLFIYQLFLEDTVEQNLVSEFYSSLSDLVNQSSSFNMEKETKEVVLKKNILKLHYIENYSLDELIANQGVVFEKEDKKLKANDFEGLFIIDKSTKILSKNSYFFQNKFTDDSWDYILNGYFSDELIYNSTEMGNSNDAENSFSSKDNSGMKTGSICKMTRNKRKPNVYGPSQFQKTSSVERSNKINVNTNSQNNINNCISISNINMNNKKALTPQNLVKTTNTPNKSDLNEIRALKKQRLVIDDDEEGVNKNKQATTNNIPNNISKPKENPKPSLVCPPDDDNIEIIILAEDDDDILINEKKKKDSDRNLIESLTNNFRKKSDDINLIRTNLNQSERVKEKAKRTALRTNTKPVFVGTSINNTLHNSFNNLSIVNNNTIVTFQSSNDCVRESIIKDVSSLISYLEKSQSEFIGYDIFQEVNSKLIKLGVNVEIRKFVCEYMMKFGINTEDFDDYIQGLLKEVNQLFSYVNLKFETLQYYFEYILFLLNKSESNPEVDHYFNLNFILGNAASFELKKSILLMSRIRELNLLQNNDDTTLNKILMQNLSSIIKQLILTNNPILKSKSNFNTYNEVIRSILISLMIGIIKCFRVFGLNQYEKMLNSELLTEDILSIFKLNKGNVDQAKNCLYQAFTSQNNYNEEVVNEFLVAFLKELSQSLIIHIIDKFY